MEIKQILSETAQERESAFNEHHSVIATIKEVGRKYLEKNERDMLPTFEHKAITFLTPNYKKLNFASYREKFQLHTQIEEYINMKYPVLGLQSSEEIERSSIVADEANDDPLSKFVSLDTDFIQSHVFQLLALVVRETSASLVVCSQIQDV